MRAKKNPVEIFNPGSAAECFRDVVEAYTEYKIVAEQEHTKRRGIEAWEKATIADIQAKIIIKKANVVLDKNQIIVDINLRIVASSPSEIPIIENLDLNGNN